METLQTNHDLDAFMCLFVMFVSLFWTLGPFFYLAMAYLLAFLRLLSYLWFFSYCTMVLRSFVLKPHEAELRRVTL